MFTDEQRAMLSAKLDQGAVRTRKQSGAQLSYIESWHAIAEANRIFGFDAWTSETVDIRCVAERERKIGSAQRDGWSVSYVAKVRVAVGDIVREGCGAGHGIDADLGLAHESAIKEAESDARKRALMTFGNPFGLALYDKDQRNVGDPSVDWNLESRAIAQMANSTKDPDALTALWVTERVKRFRQDAPADLVKALTGIFQARKAQLIAPKEAAE